MLKFKGKILFFIFLLFIIPLSTFGQEQNESNNSSKTNFTVSVKDSIAGEQVNAEAKPESTPYAVHLELIRLEEENRLQVIGGIIISITASFLITFFFYKRGTKQNEK